LRAFKSWASKGYESEGPIKHLSRNLHDNYRIVAEIYSDALEWYRKYLFTRSRPETSMEIDFPIGKVLRRAIYDPKKKTYALSYYRIRKSRGGVTTVSDSQDFIASFVFYLPK
jgi:hypothetical protein